MQRDIATFKTALQGMRYEEAFLPAVSVTNIESGRRNEHYGTEDEILQAIAKAIHEEYWAIVHAGFILQIDDPRLSTYDNVMPALSLAECRRGAEKRVEFVNLAIILVNGSSIWCSRALDIAGSLALGHTSFLKSFRPSGQCRR